MIRVVFRTNLDALKNEQWPSSLACPPQIGWHVYSATGKRARIVSIAHGEIEAHERGGRVRAPCLYVELHQ